MLKVLLRFATVSRLAAILIFAAPSAALADEIDAETRIGLRVTIEQHVEANSTAGYYRFEDTIAQQSLELTFGYLHPVIYQIGSKYLMCANFVNDTGEVVLLDFVIARREMGYTVSSIHRDQRAFFTRMGDPESLAFRPMKTSSKTMRKRRITDPLN